VGRLRWHRERSIIFAPLRYIATELPTTLLHVLDFFSVLAWVVVRHCVLIFFDLFIIDRDTVTVSEDLDLFDRHFFHLVRRIAALETCTQSVSLNGVGQDHGRFALVFH